MTQIGYYPDPPSRRMAFDADGTRVFFTTGNGSSIGEANTSIKMAMNSEGNGSSYDTSDTVGNGGYTCFIFPQKMNITHFYCRFDRTYMYADPSGGVIQWSNDTSSTVDGNWTTVASSYSANEGDTEGAPSFRTRLNSLPVVGIKALRFQMLGNYSGINGSKRIYTWHLWGHKAAGETPDRVDFCDIEGSELVQDLDFGDQPRNTDRIWTPTTTQNLGSGLYLRNRSLTKVANDISIVYETNTGPMQNLLSLSKDGASYGTQISFAQIQPQEIVGPVYVKHATQAGTTLGMWASRLRLKVGSWL